MKEFVVSSLMDTYKKLFEGGRIHERQLCVAFLREMAVLAPEEGLFPASAEKHIVRVIESLADSIEALEHLDGIEDEETLQ